MSDNRKGGYQIIDLSGVTVGTQATISGIYDKVKGNNAKPLMILTPDGQRVFAEVTKRGTSTDYISTYLGATSETFVVVFGASNTVDITQVESAGDLNARLSDVEERIDAYKINSTIGVVDLSVADYNYPNTYTAPCDGYLSVNCGTSTGNCRGFYQLQVGDNIATTVLESIYDGSLQYSGVTMYIKKGMKIGSYNTNPSGSVVNFFPLA